MTTEKTKTKNEIARERFARHKKPHSVCVCGHSGDGPNSAHRANVGGLADGHGACTADGCDCIQFSWAGWTLEFRKALDAK
jgi:hypothetical protein